LNEDPNAAILALSLEDKALKEGALMQEIPIFTAHIFIDNYNSVLWFFPFIFLALFGGWSSNDELAKSVA